MSSSCCAVRVVAGFLLLGAGVGLGACGNGGDGGDGAPMGGAETGGDATTGGRPGGGGAPSGWGSPAGASDWLRDFAEASLDVESTGGTCTADAALLAASDAARVTIGTSTLYAGFDQVSADNQDPVVARVDDGVMTWCRHHEDDAPDGRALGLTWDGGSTAYVVFTVVGGGTDLETTGWFRSYGGHAAVGGGGAKVGVVGRIDATTGALLTATHVIAILQDRKVNSHGPLDAVWVLDDGSVEYHGASAHKPLGADGWEPMGCTDYPFDTRYRFSADLLEARCAESTSCTTNVVPCD